MRVGAIMYSCSSVVANIRCLYHTLQHGISACSANTSQLQPSPLPISNTSLRSLNTMPQPRVLLLGGHGKISMLMTPMLLSKSWHVTSIIRNPDHREEVMKLGREYPGKLDVLVDSVEKYKEAKDAKALLEKTRPDYVIWAAGTQ